MRYFVLEKEGTEKMVSMPEEESDKFVERAKEIYQKVVELEQKEVHTE
jgi:coenzyme F420-reducing hydrogenase delta subunit